MIPLERSSPQTNGKMEPVLNLAEPSLKKRTGSIFLSLQDSDRPTANRQVVG